MTADPAAGTPAAAVGTRLLRADAVPSWLDDVHDVLEDLWRSVAVRATDRSCFTTAVAEVAANIVQHAAAAGAVPVRLVVQAVPDELRALFEDHGAPYQQPGGPDDDDLAESGRGLDMARVLSDELAYERDGPVNRWLVVRRCST